MANAKHDQNHVATLTGVSNADGTTVVPIYADPTTHRLLVDLAVSSGSGAPNTTPTSLGQMYIDTNAAKVYVSTGTASSGDWTILN